MKLIHIIPFCFVFLIIFADESSEEVYELSDFVVSDKNDKGYFSGSSTSATKANELIKNTPVNVTVLNQELLDDLGINTSEDLSLVASSIDTDPNSYSLDQIRIRGFRNTFTRFNGFKRTLARDGYNIARYDIIKGANSLIFGQASPGGTVNAIPLRANFRKDNGSILFSLGNNGFSKKIINYNKVFSDKIAARFMILDHYQGYENTYKNYGLKSKTFALNYRPDFTSSIQLHLEKVESSFSFPTLSLKDNTKIDDSVEGGSFEDGNTYDGYLSSSENRSMSKDFNVPFNGEWLNFADDMMLFNLFLHTRNNGFPTALSSSKFLNDPNTGFYPTQIAPGVPHPEAPSGGNYLGGQDLKALDDQGQLSVNLNNKNTVTAIASEVRNYLKDYYSIIDEHNYGYQSGPDKNKRVSGKFYTLDYQKVFDNGLELSVSVNHQNQSGRNIARDGYGITRVIDSYSDISNNWPRQSIPVFFNTVPTSLFDPFDYYDLDPISGFPILNGSNYYTTEGKEKLSMSHS